MTEAEAARSRLDMYLGEVGGTLRGLDPAEVDEILAELRSHVFERVGGEGSLNEQAVQIALDGLGSPRVLGASYLGQRMVASVERSRSPWRVLGAVYRLASFSLGAFALLLVSFVGYVTGAAFIVVGLAKPFIAGNVGMWVHKSDGSLISFGAIEPSPSGDATEVLGWWIIPISLVVGAAALIVTWRIGLAGVRALGRNSKLRPDHPTGKRTSPMSA
jgi:hypothetical protein